MASQNDYFIVSERDLQSLVDALDDFRRELKQLEIMHEWFLSDARPALEEVTRTLKAIMEIEDNEPDEDTDWIEEVERLFTELCIERERTEHYFGEVEDDEQSGDG